MPVWGACKTLTEEAMLMMMLMMMLMASPNDHNVQRRWSGTVCILDDYSTAQIPDT